MTTPDVPYGYLPPDSAYRPAFPTEGPDPDDPLINPPNTQINGWFNRVGGVFKRSWKSLVAIFAVTQLLPLIVLGVIGAVVTLAWSGYAARMVEESNGDFTVTTPPFSEEVMAIGFPVLFITLLAVVLVMIYLQSVGYAAATYAATREAAGLRVPLGEALGYGFRRGLGLLGWQVVVGLLIMLGAIACVLPAFYVYAATALFGPIYLFERESPIRRTFAIFNANVGRILGRLALLLVATIAAAIATNVLGLILDGVAKSADSLGVYLAVVGGNTALSAIIEIPLTMIVFAGILITYTEQRGHEGPATTATLANEL